MKPSFSQELRELDSVLEGVELGRVVIWMLLQAE